MTWTLRTPAKLNLGLRVGSKRSDGYHEIRTIYQTIDLTDRLIVETGTNSQEDRLEVSGMDSVPRDGNNLILQALDTLRNHGVDVPPLEVKLEKTIPTEAGLGGGSSDAAAILRLVDSLLDSNRLDHHVLEKVAREIGSDVPFLLRGGTALAEGRGTDFKAMADLEAGVILAVPPYGMATEEAYEMVRTRDLSEKAVPDPQSIRSGDWTEIDLTNDFEEMLSSEYSLHNKLRNALKQYTDSVGVTGSGSTIYGLFDPSSELQSIRDELESQFNEGVNFITAHFMGQGNFPKVERVNSCQSR